MDRYNSNAAPTGPPVPTNEHFADGGLIYSILCTLSLFLRLVLVIIYYRLNYNRIFVYFCVSIVLIFIPHALGGWIYGAQLARAPTIVCWIQGLWINAASIAGGLTVLVYTYEIYRGIVLHVPDDEYKRRKYYIAVSILFPLLVGFVPPAIIAEKPNGILPAAYFCFLYKPMIPLAFVSVEGWNTLLAIPAIYFSFRTAIEVAKIIYTRRGFDATLVTKSIGQTNSQVTIQTIHSQSQSRISDDVEQSYTPTTAVPNAPDTPHQLSPPLRLSNKTIASIPVYVCLRLLLFGLLYSAITVGISGRNLYMAIRLTEYNFRPIYTDYLIASLGILIWLVFGTSREAFRAYWRVIRLVFSMHWIRRVIWCFQNDESFGDWEIQRQKREEAERIKNLKKTLKKKKKSMMKANGNMGVAGGVGDFDDTGSQHSQMSQHSQYSNYSRRQNPYRLPPLEELSEMDISETHAL